MCFNLPLSVRRRKKTALDYNFPHTAVKARSGQNKGATRFLYEERGIDMNMSSSENRYFNADKLITHNAVYEFILSARNNGKAFYISQFEARKQQSEKKGAGNGHNV